MQAINSIQNAMINANAAAMQAALVVDSANAHRAYPFFEPCVTRVSKCPGKPSGSTGVEVVERPDVRRDHDMSDLGRLTGSGWSGRTWRLESHHTTPATIWATLVLNRTLCG